MTYKKKIISFSKLFQLFHTFEMLLILQHSDINRKEWWILQKQLKEIQDLELSVVKNKVLLKFLSHAPAMPVFGIKKQAGHHVQDREKTEQITSLFQGPCLVIGLGDLTKLDSLWSLLKSKHSLLFVGALYQGQILNHLDMDVLATLSFSTYHELITVLLEKNKLVHFFPLIQDQVCMDPLTFSLLSTLESWKNFSKSQDV